jgi:ankyrin repeat protein
MRYACGLAFGWVCIAAVLHAQTAEDVFRAIRAGDRDALRKLPLNVKDGVDTTPLHYAALYGNAESVRILLDRGADPNARNKSESTPLIYAAYDFDKTRPLVEKGADVNAHMAYGITPLMIASSVHGNISTIRYLLEKGADVKAINKLGTGCLNFAAQKGDAEMIRLLLQKGADPLLIDKSYGETALLDAPFYDPQIIQILMGAGSDVNAATTFSGSNKNGPLTLVHLTPLHFAAPVGELSTVKSLLDAGARVDEPDVRKMTPLMLAVATDEPILATVGQLISAHADVNAKDQNGESVLDWALKFRDPAVLATLRAAGAKPSVAFAAPQRPAGFTAGGPKDAIARAVPLLAKSGEVFFRDGAGCNGCHHQPLNARAYAALRAVNANPDERLRRALLDAEVAMRPLWLTSLPLQLATNSDIDQLLDETEALIDLGEPSTAFTDVILNYLAARQSPSGTWKTMLGPRPPLQSGNISHTATAIRALKIYGWPARREEFDVKIAKARVWLLAAKPVTRYEEAARIMGLKTAGVPDRDLEESVRTLVGEQRPDGGWSQTPYLESDAYATGTVLSTLNQNGFLKASDPAYARGVAYLLKTQFPDGAWYVRSRSPQVQPYFQSAFPFEHDQWISVAATALAVMALAPALR